MAYGILLIIPICPVNFLASQVKTYRLKVGSFQKQKIRAYSQPHSEVGNIRLEAGGFKPNLQTIIEQALLWN